MSPITSTQPAAVFDEKFTLGESPVWDADQQRLAFVDITGKRVHTYVPASGEHNSYATDESATSVVLSTNPDRLIVSQTHVLLEIGLSSGVTRTLATAPQAMEDGGGMWNDVRASPAGIIIGGRKAPHWDEGESGRVYSLSADDPPRLEVVLEQGKLGLPNGMAWDMGKGVMYYADTYSCKVHAIPCDATGIPTGDTQNWRTVLTLDKEQEGMPDGIAIDAAGNLWVAHEHGGQVGCYDSQSGERLHQIKMPCKRISAVAFGGPELSQLYITTIGTGDDSPHAGQLFVVDVTGARGASGAHKYG